LYLPLLRSGREDETNEYDSKKIGPLLKYALYEVLFEYERVPFTENMRQLDGRALTFLEVFLKIVHP
jgi:hypothetical protein